MFYTLIFTLYCYCFPNKTTNFPRPEVTKTNLGSSFMFCVVLSQERRVTLSCDKCLDQKSILLTKFTKIDVRQYFAFVEDRDDTQANCRFSCDLTAGGHVGVQNNSLLGL